MRAKLDGALKPFATTSENESLVGLMNNAEDWLYGDGFDSTIQEYSSKLEGLRAVGNVIESRMWEEANRPAALEALKKQLELCKVCGAVQSLIHCFHCDRFLKVFASDYDESKSHISEEERTKVREARASAESWMFDMQGQQGDLSRSTNPVLTVDSINKRRNELFAVTNPIMSKPKPKPAPVPAPSPSPAPAETKADSKEEEKEAPSSGEKGESDSKTEEVPMDV